MKKKNYKKIELIFPKIDQKIHEQAISLQKYPISGFVTTVDEIKDWFKSYDIDSIQLWINGVVQTSGVLKLFVSASGSGGVLVTLKPKSALIQKSKY
jgi:hypothetical protein